MRAALAVVAAAAAAFLGLWASVDRPVARPDTVAACDLRLAVERSWPDAYAAVGRAPEAFQRITVLSGDGAVAASRGRPMDTDREAFRAGASSFDVVVGGQRVGVLRIADGRAGELARARRRVLLLAGGAIAAISLACLALHAFHRRRIARPFAALRAFAADVAAGNLDAPLTMDRGNLFGPFTEAFDIMRDELARARRREEEAKQSKKDLVAELGHDIRTPVASIAATAELLALTETDAARRSKLETVGDLTGQIEALVADLFQANEEELAVLRVEPEVVASGEVAALLRAADPDGAIRPFDLPGCLVSVDRLRMRQVFDNVVANSRKYAATPVTVASRLEGDFLVVDVRDTGPGVPSGELEAILGKGVRGSNAAGRPGQGLGLFTASYLMERMGGSLHCRDAAPGLGVVVEIPLAR